MITKKQLMPFCADPQDDFRKILHEPFLHNGYVYACDAKVLVKIPTHLAVTDGIIEQNKIKLPADKSNTSIQFPLSDFLSFLENNNEEEEAFTWESECPECKGAGIIHTDYTATFDGRTYEASFECPICEGKGTIKTETTKKTTVSIRHGDTVMQFHSATTKKAAKALILAGETKITVSQFANPDNCNMTFTCENGISVMMAGTRPCNNTETTEEFSI